MTHEFDWELDSIVADLHDEYHWNELIRKNKKESVSDEQKLRAFTALFMTHPHSPGTIAAATLITERLKHDSIYAKIFEIPWLQALSFPNKNQYKVERLPKNADLNFLGNLYLTIIPSTRLLLSIVRHWQDDCKRRFIPMDGLSFYEFVRIMKPDLPITGHLIAQLSSILESFTAIHNEAKEVYINNNIRQTLDMARLVADILAANDEEIEQIELAIQKVKKQKTEDFIIV